MSLANFCDVWWIPNPILEALLLNSDWTATADRRSSGLTLTLLLLLLNVASSTDEMDSFWLSATLKNSCVRSRYEDSLGFPRIFFLVQLYFKDKKFNLKLKTTRNSTHVYDFSFFFLLGTMAEHLVKNLRIENELEIS